MDNGNRARTYQSGKVLGRSIIKEIPGNDENVAKGAMAPLWQVRGTEYTLVYTALQAGNSVYDTRVQRKMKQVCSPTARHGLLGRMMQSFREVVNAAVAVPRADLPRGFSVRWLRTFLVTGSKSRQRSFSHCF